MSTPFKTTFCGSPLISTSPVEQSAAYLRPGAVDCAHAGVVEGRPGEGRALPADALEACSGEVLLAELGHGHGGHRRHARSLQAVWPRQGKPSATSLGRRPPTDHPSRALQHGYHSLIVRFKGAVTQGLRPNRTGTRQVLHAGSLVVGIPVMPDLAFGQSWRVPDDHLLIHDGSRRDSNTDPHVRLEGRGIEDANLDFQTFMTLPGAPRRLAG